MACSTDVMSAKDLVIEWSSNDSDWTDLSGCMNLVDPADSTREIGEANCFDQDYPTAIAGKRPLTDVSFRFLYSEVAGESFQSLEPYYSDGSTVYMRWYPSGTSGSNMQIEGVISAFGYPGGDAASPDPIMCNCTVRGNKVVAS